MELVGLGKGQSFCTLDITPGAVLFTGWDTDGIAFDSLTIPAAVQVAG